MLTVLRLKLSALLIAAHTSCGPNQGPDQEKTSVPHSASGSAASGSAAPALGGSASATASASSPAPPDSKWVGSWAGELDSKKAKVSLDPGVTEKTWAADDGRAASGTGTVSLVVTEDGSVSGRVEGALGPGKLVGALDPAGELLSATLTPDQPDSAPAMSGTLVLAPQSGAPELTGTLRASSGSGEVVREATVKLKRKAP